MELPRFVVFKSGGDCVTYVADSESKEVALRSHDVSNPRCKFEVVPSEVHRAMVHIRCCYNNKFLLQLPSDEGGWIAANAQEAEDRQSLQTSTLFEAETRLAEDDDEHVTIRLLHVHSGLYAHQRGGDHYITADESDYENSTIWFQVIDWETLAILPRHVAFKGDNGLYLGLSRGSGKSLRFSIEDDHDKTIVNIVDMQPDGTFRIQNTSTGEFWTANRNHHITADDHTVAASDASPNSFFEAVKMKDHPNTVSLRNLGHNLFCLRCDNDGIEDSLSAFRSRTSSLRCHLQLIELVNSKRIKNITYHLDDSWVYDETTEVLNPGETVTNTTDESLSLDAEILYTAETSRTWKSTSSSFIHLGPVVRIQPIEIPHIQNSSIVATKRKSDTTRSFVWGDTIHNQREKLISHTVRLRPGTQVTVKLLAKKATCAVPLTYTRYDHIRGKEEIRQMADGLYTGSNYFDFTFDVSDPEQVAY